MNDRYQPIVGGWLAEPFRMCYVASIIVCNARDFGRIYDPLNAATASTCDRYALRCRGPTPRSDLNTHRFGH